MRVTEVENQGKVCDRKWTHWLWVASGIPRGLVLLAVGHGRLKFKGKVQDLSLTISVSSVQFSHSVVSDSLLPHGLYHARLPCPSPTSGAYSNSCPSSWWCHPTISSSVVPFLPPSILPSIRVFSNESVWQWTMYWVRWPKYWSFSFSISPSDEYSGLISFRMDWLDLLAIQGTLKSLLHHHSSKVSNLWRSAFFIVQLSHLYTTTGKTINLTRQTFVGEVMSLLFLICCLSWSELFFQGVSFNFMAAVTSCSDFGAPQNKVSHCFHCFPIYCHEVIGPDAMIFLFWMLGFKSTFHFPLPLST